MYSSRASITWSKAQFSPGARSKERTENHVRKSLLRERPSCCRTVHLRWLPRSFPGLQMTPNRSAAWSSRGEPPRRARMTLSAHRSPSPLRMAFAGTRVDPDAATCPRLARKPRCARRPPATGGQPPNQWRPLPFPPLRRYARRRTRARTAVIRALHPIDPQQLCRARGGSTTAAAVVGPHGLTSGLAQGIVWGFATRAAPAGGTPLRWRQRVTPRRAPSACRRRPTPSHPAAVFSPLFFDAHLTGRAPRSPAPHLPG